MKASKKPEKIIFNPEYFFTRVDLLKHLKFPKSSTHVLIIPSNSQALGFRPNSIPDRYLTYKLDRSLLENSIVNANQIFEAVWKKKKAFRTK